LRLEARHAHVHAYLSVRLEARADDAAVGLDDDLVLVRQAPVAHETREATRAVAALLHLFAIGVVDPIAEIGAVLRRPFDHEDLVATDAEVAVREAADFFRCEREWVTDGVEDDEIVAGSVHLRERNLHGIESLPRTRH